MCQKKLTVDWRGWAGQGNATLYTLFIQTSHTHQR